MRFFDVPVHSFNIEITNRCTLACPECARTGNPWVRANLTDLPVEVLERVFARERARRFEGLHVNLCGAHGDCIYHRDFHRVLRHLKRVGLKVGIETNGSFRKLDWWAETCAILGDDDTINFSVDGLADTNHIYRVNARWDDIEAAMRYCAPRVHTSWKFIVFRHNEHQVDEARELAESIGVRQITFKKSARFSADDSLAPENDEFIGVVARNRQAIQKLRAAGAPDEVFDQQVHIRPKCQYGANLAITALGYFYPCTSCESGDTSTWFHRNRDAFDLRVHDIEAILASPSWLELAQLWTRASAAPASCLRYCGVHEAFESRFPREATPGRPYRPTDAVRVDLERV
jgi:MoaA/NifB/PqqE/SkfB family radical SAM enzyme